MFLHGGNKGNEGLKWFISVLSINNSCFLSLTFSLFPSNSLCENVAKSMDQGLVELRSAEDVFEKAYAAL